MAFYHKSPEADDDLLRIWHYIAQDNRATATQFIDRLHGTMGTLAEMLGMGRPRDDLAPNIRTFPLGNYLNHLPGNVRRYRSRPRAERKARLPAHLHQPVTVLAERQPSMRPVQAQRKRIVPSSS